MASSPSDAAHHAPARRPTAADGTLNRRMSLSMAALLRAPANPSQQPESSVSKNLGVLFTGYLDKQHPYRGHYKRRFVVLTQEAIHWFKRADGYDLFGEERGQVSLVNVLTVRILDEDPCIFELQGTDFNKRYFKSSSSSECEEWVSAIRSAVKTHSTPQKKKRRNSFDGEEAGSVDGAPKPPSDEVSVILVSLQSTVTHAETVIARRPNLERLVFVNNVRPGDVLLLSTSNGGLASLSYDLLVDKADLESTFEVGIHNVLLASSLKLRVMTEEIAGGELRTVFAPSDGSTGGSSAVTNTSSGSDKAKRMSNLVTALRKVAGNASNVQPLILSSMAIMISLRCLILAITKSMDTSYLHLIAVCLLMSGYAAHRVFVEAVSPDKDSQGSRNFQLLIIDHQYTSPDAPVKAAEDEIPQRFINGCDGDLKEARRRWDITRKWREDEGINTILEEEQPHFSTIKTLYPHYICGQGKEGHVVYYERPGEIELNQLKARGISMDNMLRHWLFVTEYQWKYVVPDPLGKSIAVIDMGAVKMGDLAGEALEFVRKCVSIANQHFPERAFVVFLVNVPGWFSWLWRLIKPLVHEKKMKILSKKEVLQGLLEHIDASQIPIDYGGELDMGGPDSCRYESPYEKQLAEYVKKLNARCQRKRDGLPETEDDEEENNDTNTPAGGTSDSPRAPPGVPGDMSHVPHRQLLSSDDGSDSYTYGKVKRSTTPEPTSGGGHRDGVAANKSGIRGQVSQDFSISSDITAPVSLPPTNGSAQRRGSMRGAPPAFTAPSSHPNEDADDWSVSSASGEFGALHPHQAALYRRKHNHRGNHQ